MQAYNVEIFDRNMNLIHHQTAEISKFIDDYMSLTENEIEMLKVPEAVSSECFIKFQKEKEEKVYIISSTEKKDNEICLVKFKSLLSLLDRSFVFDTNNQGSSRSLEGCIVQYINKIYQESSDDFEIKKVKAIQGNSQTLNWGFNYKSDKQDGHHLIMNLYQKLIVKSFEKYQITVKPIFDLKTKKIMLRVEKNQKASIYIEADLDNVLSKNIKVKSNNESINKLEIYDSTYNKHTTYYLHDDLTYDQNASIKRIIPVKTEIATVESEEGSTFQQTAQKAASERFSGKTFDNLIEIEVMKNDQLIHPEKLEIGQEVNIISKNAIYPSILSGKEIENTVRLIFGTIRIDLVKILERLKNG